MGSNSVNGRNHPLPESLHATVGKAVLQMNDAFPQKDVVPGRLSTPPQPLNSPLADWEDSPSTPRPMPELNHDVDTQEKGLSRSQGAYTTRPRSSMETGISFGSTVQSTSTSIPVSQRKANATAVETHSDDRPGRSFGETDMIASSSLPTRTLLAAEAYLHPSSAAAASLHPRPTRRNTTGSVVVQLPPRPTRQLTGHKHMSSQPTFELSDHLDSDILEQADQIRRERLSKRAKAQQEAEAAVTRAHSKRTVSEEEKVLVGNLIGEDHVNYVLMYNMLTGIRIGVSRCQAKVKRPLTDEDFIARHKFSFDMSVFLSATYLY